MYTSTWFPVGTKSLAAVMPCQIYHKYKLPAEKNHQPPAVVTSRKRGVCGLTDLCSTN